VLALVLRQVDVPESLVDHRLHRAEEARAVAEEGEDGAVVVRVGRPVEEEDPRTGGDRRVPDGGDHFRAPAFADVRDAFDQCRHLNLCPLGAEDLTAGPDGACRRIASLLR